MLTTLSSSRCPVYCREARTIIVYDLTPLVKYCEVRFLSVSRNVIFYHSHTFIFTNLTHQDKLQLID